MPDTNRPLTIADLEPALEETQQRIGNLESQLQATEKWCEELVALIQAQEQRIAAIERRHAASVARLESVAPLRPIEGQDRRQT